MIVFIICIQKTTSISSIEDHTRSLSSRKNNTPVSKLDNSTVSEVDLFTSESEDKREISRTEGGKNPSYKVFNTIL